MTMPAGFDVTRRSACLALLAVTFSSSRSLGGLDGPRHAIAMHGEPELPEGFAHFRYANPAAPKGGRLAQGLVGTFDSLNPYIVKGVAPFGVRGAFISNSNVMSGYVIESLMARGYDEPFTLYGLLARTVETDTARSYVTFNLDPGARFSDGKPVTPQDVLFSWEILRDKGRPNHRTYYSKVVKAEATGERSVRFDLAGSEDRELPMILGLMPVLAKHATNPDTFEDSSLTPMLGSGPYTVGKVEPGRTLTLLRDPNYWGRDLPVNRGFWNFDEIRFEYFRDSNAHQEGFVRGLFDLRTETDPGRWQTGYDVPPVRDGRIVKETFTTSLPKPTFYYVFNTRRSMFTDVRVREAIATLFDFEWINQKLYFGLYGRAASYFPDSELSAFGRPADAGERALLAPFPDAVRSDVLDGTWKPPAGDGSGRDRTTLRRALALFKQAGYELRGTELVERRTGTPFTFELMATGREEERLALTFASQLRRAGITLQIRMVDAVQYEARRIRFDFDMLRYRWDQSLSPGNEQHFYWSSAAADAEGSRNYMGVKSPAVDAMIAHLIRAQDRAEVVAAVRALDRVMISGFYTLPLFHLPSQWAARWSVIERPEISSQSGYVPEAWWRKPQ
jgi:peptide/nickel transport system substrate-binding protein